MIDYLRQVPIYQDQTLQEYHQWLHQRLLKSYIIYCSENDEDWLWHPDDGYYFQYLVHHAIEAGADSFLQDLVSNFNWMTAKINADKGLYDLSIDLCNCKEYLRNNLKVSKTLLLVITD